MDSVHPDLSVIICPTSSTPDSVKASLVALYQSARGLNFECLVPYDDRLDRQAELHEQYGWVRFLDGQDIVLRYGLARESHERHHVLRALALNAARGRIVAMIEDHGLPSDNWAQAVLAAHERRDSVIGGAVENRVDRPLNWAVYYSDFGRFQRPLPTGPVRWVTDVNVSYKRECLDQVKPLWQKMYSEPTVHDALRAAGHQLVLDERIVVFQNRQLHLRSALIERYVWARSFASTRARRTSPIARWLLAGFSFGLPLLRSLRVVGRAIRRRRNLDRMIVALPLLLLLEIFWAAGEFMGYLTATPYGTGGLCPSPQPCAPLSS